MFGDNNSSIDNETIELLENAQSRIRQKKNAVAVLIFICVIPIIIGNTYREKENSSL